MSDEGYEDEEEFFSGGSIIVTTSQNTTLRWSPIVFLTDLIGTIGGMFEVWGNFFTEQARSLAATAAHKEEAKDRRDMAKSVESDLKKLSVTEEE